MSYRESLTVTWLICWRTAVILVLFGGMSAALYYELVLGLKFSDWSKQSQDQFSLGGWLWGSAAEVAFYYFYIVRKALTKRYAGFSLRLDRSGSSECVR